MTNFSKDSSPTGGDGQAPHADDIRLVIAWDPASLTPEEYGELVKALGDVARAFGAAGVRRVDDVGIRVSNLVPA